MDFDHDATDFVLPPEAETTFPFDDFFSDSSDSDDEEFLEQVVGALRAIENPPPRTRRYICRDRVAAHENLMNDYFVENPKFDAGVFRSRFGIPKELFLRISTDINSKYRWFQHRDDARKKTGFSCLQKCTSAIRQLTTGNTPDEYDEYLAMSERTSRESLEFFCKAVILLYREEYLRKPTSHDIARLYEAHERRWGLPGMLGSIDCTHVVWRMCPTELRGQFMRGDHEYPTIMLEAVVSNDLWFWHSYFGPAGSNNDINVLNQSPLLNDDLHGKAPRCPFQVNNRDYSRGYYLADGIYPSWPVFVKSFSFPVDPKEIRFKKVQESARKDVERGFGVLKSRWRILQRPLRAKDRDKIRHLVYTCIILHNMILKHDGRAISPNHVLDPPTDEYVDPYILYQLHDSDLHFRLRFDLTEHIASLPPWNDDPDPIPDLNVF